MNHFQIEKFGSMVVVSVSHFVSSSPLVSDHVREQDSLTSYCTGFALGPVA